MRAILLLLLGLTMLSGCGSSDEKLKIGFMGTLSGRYSDLGQATLQGVLLAIESSGMQHKVELIVKDDTGDPNEGKKVLKSFEKENVHYVIGPSISSVASEIVPVLDASDIYMISPTVSTSALAGKKDKFFRTMPHNSIKQAKVISNYVFNKLHIDDVVVLYDSRNSSYSNDIVKKFTETFMNCGGFIKDVRSFNPDSGESLADLVSIDKKQPPQMYYVIGSAMDTALITWQIRKMGYASKILIRKWAASGEFFRLGGEAVEGALLFDYYVDAATPAYVDFVYRYKKKFQKEPAWMSIYGYEATYMLMKVLEKDRSPKDFEQSFTKAASENRLLVNMKFDEFGDAFLPLHHFAINNGNVEYKGLAE